MEDHSIRKFGDIQDDIDKLEGDFKRIGRRLPPSFLSVYGEIIGCIELSKVFGSRYQINYKGGQAKSDIELISKNNPKDKILIEVKTSTYKDEYFGTGFGWALKKKLCRAHKKIDYCYLDYLLLIGVNNKHQFRFFIFSKGEIQNAPPRRSKRFKAPSNRIVMPFEKINLENVEKWDLNLMKNLSKYQNRWNKIKL